MNGVTLKLKSLAGPGFPATLPRKVIAVESAGKHDANRQVMAIGKAAERVAESKSTAFTTAAGWLLVVLGLMVLAGWVFQVHSLLWVPLGTMKSNTASALLLVGVALLRRNYSDLLFYSLAVQALGAVTLLEYVSGSDFGIDQWLFQDPDSGPNPGRMSQITCVGLILLGAALFLLKAGSKTVRRLSRSLAWLAGSIGFLALLGYSYETPALYQAHPRTSMTLYTALAFCLAGVAIQFANPREGVARLIHSDTAGGAMLRRLLPAALLVPFLIGLTAWWGYRDLGWEPGFSMAVVVAFTTFCLAVIMLRNAVRLEEEDLELREINDTLEDRVRQRTAELATRIRERGQLQEKLDEQRAQMMAVSKLSALGEMARGLAHEINNPLQAIRDWACDLQELAQAGGEVRASAVLKATGRILRTEERMAAVVRGLRTFAHDGRADSFEKATIQGILDDTLALCRERFAAHGVELAVPTLEGAPMVPCQRTQISHVLLNLLNNGFDAVQSLSRKWVRILVSEEPEFISISVMDSGRGIPREIAENAMHPFFSTKPLDKGTGLGLSISRSIAEAHHGRLSIDPRGPNTRVTLTLPKLRPEPERPAQTTLGRTNLFDLST